LVGGVIIIIIIIIIINRIQGLLRNLFLSGLAQFSCLWLCAGGQNNNNNNHDNVHGAVIVTKAIERVHPVHLMNAD